MLTSGHEPLCLLVLCPLRFAPVVAWKGQSWPFWNHGLYSWLESYSYQTRSWTPPSHDCCSDILQTLLSFFWNILNQKPNFKYFQNIFSFLIFVKRILYWFFFLQGLSKVFHKTLHKKHSTQQIHFHTGHFSNNKGKKLNTRKQNWSLPSVLWDSSQ